MSFFIISLTSLRLSIYSKNSLIFELSIDITFYNLVKNVCQQLCFKLHSPREEALPIFSLQRTKKRQKSGILFSKISMKLSSCLKYRASALRKNKDFPRFYTSYVSVPVSPSNKTFYTLFRHCIYLESGARCTFSFLIFYGILKRNDTRTTSLI